MKRLIHVIAAVFLLTVLTPAVFARDLYREAEELFEQGNYEAAADLYKSFIKSRPEDHLRPAAAMSLAWCLIHLDRPDQALLILDSAQEEDWARMEALHLYTRGIALYRLKRPSDAIDAFSVLDQRYPGSPLAEDADLYKALALADLDRPEAIEALSAAIARNAGADALKARYRIYMNRHDYVSALGDISALISAMRSDAAESYVFEKSLLEERLEVSNAATLEDYLARYPEGAHAARVHRMLADISSDTAEQRRHLFLAISIGDREPYATENQLLFAELSAAAGNNYAAIVAWKSVVSRNALSLEGVTAFRRLDKLLPPDDGYLSSVARKLVRDKLDELEEIGLADIALNRIILSRYRPEALKLAWDKASRAGAPIEERARWADRLRSWGDTEIADIAFIDKDLVVAAEQAPMTETKTVLPRQSDTFAAVPLQPVAASPAVPRREGPAPLFHFLRSRPVRVAIMSPDIGMSGGNDWIKPLLFAIRTKISEGVDFVLAENNIWTDKNDIDVMISFETRRTSSGLELEVKYQTTDPEIVKRSVHEVGDIPDMDGYRRLAEKILAELRM